MTAVPPSPPHAPSSTGRADRSGAPRRARLGRAPLWLRVAALAAAVVAAALPLRGAARADERPADPPSAASTPAAREEDERFERIAAGWKATPRGETTVYCRTETRLGTRLGKTVCLTRQQLLDRARAGQDARDRMTKPNQCAGKCTEGG
jgi:hypothetical protein